MKKAFFLIYSNFLLSCIFGQTAIDGNYIGFEKICWRTSKKGECLNTDKTQPGMRWYHQSILKIRGDSAFLDQNPVIVYKNDTSYSASDGAFFYYSGTVKRNDTSILINLTELFCDYCGRPMKKQINSSLKSLKRTKLYLGRYLTDGFLINEILYKRTDGKQILISEHPEPYLKND